MSVEILTIQVVKFVDAVNRLTSCFQDICHRFLVINTKINMILLHHYYSESHKSPLWLITMCISHLIIFINPLPTFWLLASLPLLSFTTLSQPC